MPEENDLKEEFIRQSQSRDHISRGPNRLYGGSATPSAYSVKKFLAIVAIVVAGALSAWAVLNNVSTESCSGVNFQGNDIAPDLIQKLQKCSPVEIFKMAEEHRGKNLQHALILYEYAAQARSHQAARVIGEMYDPLKWSSSTSPFPKPDQVNALKWYSKAYAFGDVSVQPRIQALSQVATGDKAP